MATSHKHRQPIPLQPPIVTARFTAGDAQLGAIQLRALAHGAPREAAELLVRLAEGMERAS